MTTMVDVLLDGCPALSDRGFAGISTVALVTNSRNRILFDTGSIGDRRGLLAAIAHRKILPSDIDIVVLSHLHFDHAGNAELFPDAKIVLHANELPYALDEDNGDLGYSRQITDYVASRPNLEVMATTDEGLSDEVSLRLSPGHTPGSLTLTVDSADGKVTLAGDAVKNRSDLAAGRSEQVVWNHDAWSASVSSLVKFSSTLLPGHDVPLRLKDGKAFPVREGKRPWSVPDYVGSSEPVNVGVD